MEAAQCPDFGTNLKKLRGGTFQNKAVSTFTTIPHSILFGSG